MSYPGKAHNKKEPLSPKEARNKIAHFCAYQERSHYEVRNRLFDYGLHTDQVEEVLCDLILDGFINEERFATSYAGGKFRMKKWGKNKIIQGLRSHEISEYCIQKALSEIDETAYVDTLADLLKAKKNTIGEKNKYERNHILAGFVISKGYEPDLVWNLLNKGY